VRVARHRLKLKTTASIIWLPATHRPRSRFPGRRKLRGREGHPSCAVRKTGNEAECRDALLTAIAKARGWIDDIRLGRIGSFAEIAERDVRSLIAAAPAPSPSRHGDEPQQPRGSGSWRGEGDAITGTKMATHWRVAKVPELEERAPGGRLKSKAAM